MVSIRTAMNRGAFDFLIKPIDFLDFEATIAKTIGAVHPAPRNTKRVRNKPFRRQTRTTHIATRKTRPRNVKLTAHTSRYRLQTAVQNVNPRVPDRTANRNDIVKSLCPDTGKQALKVVPSVGP